MKKFAVITVIMRQSEEYIFMEVNIMATVKWQSVCSCCQRGGPSVSMSDTMGQPRNNPPAIGGKCPSSPDGKHKPMWKKVS